MRRAFALAAVLFIASCAHAPASTLTPITDVPTANGDFDGDGRADSVGFFENDEGALLVVVQRAASPRPIEIWGGDISSLERFTFRVAPPSRYTKLCSIYGTGCVNESIDIALERDGIIVEGLEDLSRTLYYWANGEFKNVSILE